MYVYPYDHIQCEELTDDGYTTDEDVNTYLDYLADTDPHEPDVLDIDFHPVHRKQSHDKENQDH